VKPVPLRIYCTDGTVLYQSEGAIHWKGDQTVAHVKAEVWNTIIAMDLLCPGVEAISSFDLTCNGKPLQDLDRIRDLEKGADVAFVVHVKNHAYQTRTTMALVAASVVLVYVSYFIWKVISEEVEDKTDNKDAESDDEERDDAESVDGDVYFKYFERFSLNSDSVKEFEVKMENVLSTVRACMGDFTALPAAVQGNCSAALERFKEDESGDKVKHFPVYNLVLVSSYSSIKTTINGRLSLIKFGRSRIITRGEAYVIQADPDSPTSVKLVKSIQNIEESRFINEKRKKRRDKTVIAYGEACDKVR
jgi:hypothetical protein